MSYDIIRSPGWLGICSLKSILSDWFTYEYERHFSGLPPYVPRDEDSWKAFWYR